MLKLKLVRYTLALASIGLFFARPVAAQNVVQSYTATQSLQVGMIVSLANGQTNAVSQATMANQSKMFGVVINPTDTSVVLTGGSGQQVFVATSGTYDVLVSNEGGVIKTGDYVTVSSLDGVGMKTGGSQQYVLGKADGGFDGKNDVINTVTLTNSAGQKESVALGEIPVALQIGHNPLEVYQQADVPGFLAHFSQGVSSKVVPAPRIYLSLALVLMTIVVVAIMLYSGIRNGMVAIGRNPLSKRSIVHGLWQVIVTSLLLFVIGIGGAFLIIRL